MTNLFDYKKGQILRDKGIARAVSHANSQEPRWADKAYSFLLEFLDDHTTFLTEEVRREAIGSIPEPPSKRAWGGVVVRACKAGYIKKIGHKNVSNPAAHCTPATLWESEADK